MFCLVCFCPLCRVPQMPTGVRTMYRVGTQKAQDPLIQEYSNHIREPSAVGVSSQLSHIGLSSWYVGNLGFGAHCRASCCDL